MVANANTMGIGFDVMNVAVVGGLIVHRRRQAELVCSEAATLGESWKGIGTILAVVVGISNVYPRGDPRTVDMIARAGALAESQTGRSRGWAVGFDLRLGHRKARWRRYYLTKVPEEGVVGDK